MSQKEIVEKASDLVAGRDAVGGSKSADPVATGNPHEKRGADKIGQGDMASKKLDGDVEMTDPNNNTKPTGDNSAKNKSTVAAKPSAASMKEEIDGLFGDDLSEEFKEKASVVFEAAVAGRIADERRALEEQIADERRALEESFEQAKADLTEELSNQVSDYLDYVVEQWMAANQVAIDSSLNTIIAEEFIEKLKGLFEESYIQVPKEKTDLVAEMAEQVEALEAKLNATIEENIELSKLVESSQQAQVFDEVTEGLVMTQVEKLRTLAEGVEFDTAENYRKKLEIVKEQYFGEKKTTTVKSIEENEIVELDEEVTHTPAKATGPVAGYVSAIARTVKK